ncbi:hypothetical protein LTR66_002525 [Elasticomyces elasticus]|nr:hypothetical protein LTR66_002525 [Elasticomyces elasticus]KAK5003478.1 hypothetical protein LTR28_010130 [Elasticomyces elasticus]
MLRHGYLRSPIPWCEVDKPGFKGIWMILNEDETPDIVVYYCHGGGFSMGSSYFYMEFLLAWVTLLKEAGYKNPALLALEYTLVPEATYPTQLQQTLAGYEYAEAKVADSSRICVGGDSAGATLILSLLLLMSDHPDYENWLPGLAVMISPWVTIVSPKNRDTASDYLNADSLHLYGSQYAGKRGSLDDPLVSPGKCKDTTWWRRATPSQGWYFLFGSEEVFGPETRELIRMLKDGGVQVEEHEEPGWIHAWPVVKLFLGDGQRARQSGLRSIARVTRQRLV